MSQAVVDEIMMSNALLRTHARRRGLTADHPDLHFALLASFGIYPGTGHYNLRGDDDDDDLFIPIISNQKVTGTLRGPTTWCNGTDSGEKTFKKQSSSLGDDTGLLGASLPFLRTLVKHISVLHAALAR